jgi:hypothetical protein
MWRTRRDWPSRERLACFFGISLILLFSGCAQLDQLLGKGAEAGKPAPPAQTVAPTPAADEKHPVQATEPISTPLTKKKADESRPSSVVTEPRQQVPSHVPANPIEPVAGAAKQPEPAVKQSEQDKALAEKEPPLKEKKSRVATDKKSKKSPKPQVKPQTPTEDAFLPPVPIPSKPAAIGGSGG